jgi:hypothetical protein
MPQVKKDPEAGLPMLPDDIDPEIEKAVRTVKYTLRAAPSYLHPDINPPYPELLSSKMQNHPTADTSTQALNPYHST